MYWIDKMGVGYILMAILMSATLGLFFGAIFTSEMQDSAKKVIIMCIIALVIGFGFTSLIKSENDTDIKNWNNGICYKCGEELDLFDIVHYHNSGNKYYYKCSNGHIITTRSLFEKD